MDLRNGIRSDLWETIQKNYDNESYSNAILDSMYLLTETIRNKTGLEGDGSSLVGQALGGSNPKIQLNKLQTESDKNIQKGIQEILKGMYTAIRNPRSHDKYPDTKEEADAIISFLNYLLKMIDKSKVSFEEETYLERVFEKHYVNTEEYSDLLVNEIPKRQRMNIAVLVILKREEADIYNLGSFTTALFKKLEENELQQVYKLVSEELKYASLDSEISSILYIFENHWNENIEKVVKLRIENMLFKNVENGKCDIKGNCRYGSLGTWISREQLKKFENPIEWTEMLIYKKQHGNEEEKMYVNRYFWHSICHVNYYEINDELAYYFSEGLINKDESVIEELKSQILFDEHHPWWKVFEKELESFPEINNDDSLPF